jgi:hypothetical protein
VTADHRYGALIVDYGGVMTTSVGASFAAFCLESGVDPERFRAIVAEACGTEGSDGMIARVERGSLAPAAFERWLAGALSEGRGSPLQARGIRNVEGARAVGMLAFVHRSAEYTVPRLEETFSLELRSGRGSGH